jgi:spoIIIJ-associated protein
MKDHVFSGADVPEALALAAANLGLPLSELRYVVLEKGAPGARGLSPTPARIAVLLHEEPEPGSRPARAARAAQPTPAPGEPQDPSAGIRDTLRAIAEAGGLAVSAEIEDGPEAVIVHLRGDDREFFLEPDGQAEVLRATEHLLLRLYGAALQPRALRLTGEGFRERRDEALAAEARRVAAAVRGDGVARTMPPMNAYERRVVHVALQDEPGIRTASSGEGAERRLTVAPAAPAQGDAPAE